MSNRISIDTMEQVDFKSREASYAIHIYDDYSETTIFVKKEEIDCDDMDVLRNVIKAKHRSDLHGGSCQIIEEMLDFVEENAKGITIANEFYDYGDLSEVLKFDYRRLYKCPKCGWESFDDDSYVCNRGDDCDGVMEFVEEEEYEK